MNFFIGWGKSPIKVPLGFNKYKTFGGYSVAQLRWGRVFIRFEWGHS